MRLRRPPVYSFWIDGPPRSQDAQKKLGYVQRIKRAATNLVPGPLQSTRLDIDIIFAARDRLVRPDVDNVAKPILDALKDVLYADDRQVRSVRVVALPLDDVFRLRGEPKTLDRLFKTEQFLINVYDGLVLDVWIGQAKEIRL